MPNAIVNVERNGGFGSSVISYLLQTPIKKNLYFEIKDRVLEERSDGIHTVRHKQRTKVYGLDSTKDTRDRLMEILRERMNYHKDKFISPIIYHELETLELKKNGKIEHCQDGHDDQIFSYLLALYVWYEGKGLVENWGLQKTTIKCEDSIDEPMYSAANEERLPDITEEDDDIVAPQMEYINSDNSITYDQWEKMEYQKDHELLEQLLKSDKLARMAYCKKYNVDEPENVGQGMYTIPASVFTNFNASEMAYNPNVTIMDPDAIFHRMTGL